LPPLPKTIAVTETSGASIAAVVARLDGGGARGAALPAPDAALSAARDDRSTRAAWRLRLWADFPLGSPRRLLV